MIERTNSEGKTSKDYEKRPYEILKQNLVDLNSQAIVGYIWVANLKMK